VEELAKFSGVPVYNGLTDEYHPTQVLADLLTMREQSKKPLRKVSFCFLGDAGNNMGDSLLIGGAKMGMDVRLCAPKACWPDTEIIAYAEKTAAETGAHVTITDNVEKAVKDCDGRARGEMGGAHQAAEALSGECAGYEADGKTQHQVHALPAGLSQHGNRSCQGH
jgi:ornithine carbamoyltransferase